MLATYPTLDQANAPEAWAEARRMVEQAERDKILNDLDADWQALYDSLDAAIATCFRFRHHKYNSIINLGTRRSIADDICQELSGLQERMRQWGARNRKYQQRQRKRAEEEQAKQAAE